MASRDDTIAALETTVADNLQTLDAMVAGKAALEQAVAEKQAALERATAQRVTSSFQQQVQAAKLEQAATLEVAAELEAAETERQLLEEAQRQQAADAQNAAALGGDGALQLSSKRLRRRTALERATAQRHRSLRAAGPAGWRHVMAAVMLRLACCRRRRRGYRSREERGRDEAPADTSALQQLTTWRRRTDAARRVAHCEGVRGVGRRQRQTCIGAKSQLVGKEECDGPSTGDGGTCGAGGGSRESLVGWRR